MDDSDSNHHGNECHYSAASTFTMPIDNHKVMQIVLLLLTGMEL